MTDCPGRIRVETSFGTLSFKKEGRCCGAAGHPPPCNAQVALTLGLVSGPVSVRLEWETEAPPAPPPPARPST